MFDASTNKALLKCDYFELLNLPRSFDLNMALLDKNYRTFASQVHPDRFINSSEAEKNQALSLSSQVNLAYQTLKSSLERACYLLFLAGIDVKAESTTSMPESFLLSQIEWREAISEAMFDSDIESLESLSSEIAKEVDLLKHNLIHDFDQTNNLNAAAFIVRKWCFLAKLEEKIVEGIQYLLD